MILAVMTVCCTNEKNKKNMTLLTNVNSHECNEALLKNMNKNNFTKYDRQLTFPL